MFGLFRSDPYADNILGSLERRGGYWHGAMDLPPHGNLRLLVSGPRKAPDAAGLSAAHRLPIEYQACRAAIETALFAHYQPAAQAFARGELEDEGDLLPTIANAGDVWRFVYPQYIHVEANGANRGTELALGVEWDQEHWLGARIRDGRLSELCCSIRLLI